MLERTIDLQAIEARIDDCASYNFGLRNADQLAHVDAPDLLIALRKAEAERDGLLAMVASHPDALRVAAASALEAAAEYSNREMFFTVTRPEIWIMLHARAAEYRKTTESEAGHE